MTRDERQLLFRQMIDTATKLVDVDGVLGMVVIIVPTKGTDGRPIAAIGGHFSLGELDGAFAEVMKQLEILAAVDTCGTDATPSEEPPAKKVLH